MANADLFIYTVLMLVTAQSLAVGCILTVQPSASLTGRLTGPAVFFLVALVHGIDAAYSLGIKNPIAGSLPFVQAPALFLTGPAIYSFVRRLLPFQVRHSKFSPIIHVVPAVFILLILTTGWGAGVAWIDEVIWLGVAVHVGVYLSASALIVMRQMRGVPQVLSYLESGQERRLRRLLMIVFAAWALLTLQVFAEIIAGQSDYTVFPFLTARAFAIIAASFAALYPSPLVPFDLRSRLPTPEAPSGSPVRYRKSSLDNEAAARIALRINAALRDEQIFKNSFLTLQDLSRQLAITPHKLSQTLNVYMGKTFFDVVNEARVLYVQKRLQEGSGETVLELATEAGFNSKSTFNAAFKKITGLSPSAYRTKRKETADGDRH